MPKTKQPRTSLGAALQKAAAGPRSAKHAPLEDAPKRKVGAKTARADRAGRVNVTGYFDPAVRSSIRMIQAQHPELSLQDILAEALDDVFSKYGVPQSARLRGAGAR
jgi:hypothetical protein